MASRPYVSIPKSNEFLDNEKEKEIHKNLLNQHKMMQKQRKNKPQINKATSTQAYIKQTIQPSCFYFLPSSPF